MKLSKSVRQPYPSFFPNVPRRDCILTEDEWLVGMELSLKRGLFSGCIFFLRA